MVELVHPVDFAKYPHIRPVCLPGHGEEDYRDEVATVTGWGLHSVEYKRFIQQGIVKGIGYGKAKTLKKLDVRCDHNI